MPRNVCLPQTLSAALAPKPLLKPEFQTMLIFSLIVCTAAGMLIHEFGHLLAARRSGISCTELGLGLGPELCSIKFGNVRFTLRLIPLGSFVRLDGTALKTRSLGRQLCVHLAGIVFNFVCACAFYGTTFGWVNLLIGAGNLLPLYQHDGWKCGVAILRALMCRKSQPAEWALTFSGGFVSLVIAWAIARMFV
jgi:membrane-associated protease RseP (regulator of RpoE activity)